MNRYVSIIVHGDPAGHNPLVLFIRKDRPAWQAGFMNAPGGKAEPGESMLDAAVRKLREETTLDLPASQFRLVVVLHGTDGGRNPHEHEVFAVRVPAQTLKRLDGALAPGETELLEAWSASDVWFKSCVRHLRWMVPLALDQHILSGCSYEFPVTVRER